MKSWILRQAEGPNWLKFRASDLNGLEGSCGSGYTHCCEFLGRESLDEPHSGGLRPMERLMDTVMVGLKISSLSFSLHYYCRSDVASLDEVVA
jgi:hypothetical protein